MSEENKNLVRRWFEESDRFGRLSSDYVTPDFVAHLPADAPPMEFGPFEQFIGMFYRAFSNLGHTFEEMVAEGDMVAFRILVRASHTGELMGMPPIGKDVSFSQVGMARIVDGKVAEIWNNMDQMGVMQQIGAIPARGEVETV